MHKSLIERKTIRTNKKRANNIALIQFLLRAFHLHLLSLVHSFYLTEIILPTQGAEI